MKIKIKKYKERARLLVIVSLCVISISDTFAYSQENNGLETVASTGAAKTSKHAPRREKAADETYKQLYSAITDLNYKIEYLQSNYNRLNTDIESLRTADREQEKAFDDRITSIPLPDMSKIENLETESALMRSEISQIRSDIADIKIRLDYRGQTAERQEKSEKALHSPWIAIGALGLSIVALITR